MTIIILYQFECVAFKEEGREHTASPVASAVASVEITTTARSLQRGEKHVHVVVVVVIIIIIIIFGAYANDFLSPLPVVAI